MIQNILLATDGSAAAGRAADFAASLALRFDAGLTILYVHSPTAAKPSAILPPYDPAQGLVSAQALVADLAIRLHQMGVASVETEVVEGPAITVILGVAESRRPDMLVMGARGAGTWPGRFLGSVSNAVLQRAECPVLIIK
jgi:nucleotide-binding universal stress UspA family protein